MKIAISLNDSWYGYNFRFNLGLALQKYGYEVVFIAPYSKYSEKLKKRFEYEDISLNAQGKNPIKDIKTIFDFYQIYKRIKPDLILHYTIKPNIYGTIAASLLNIPTINNITGLGTIFIRQSIVTRIVKLLYKYSFKRATKVFFQNKDDLDMFLNEKLIEKFKCDLLPGSGVDIEKFKPIKSVDRNKFRFLLVSRMLWDKGIAEYIAAARVIKKRYSHVEFQLLGFLDIKSPTSITKKQMDIWVNEGIVDYIGVSDDVREQISQVECVTLPSYREGVPRTLLEAASMEKPIITTFSAGCKEVVDDKVNGYLCKVKSVDDLVKKMDLMINLSYEERLIMGKAGRKKIVTEFDEKIVINQYLKSIKEILG